MVDSILSGVDGCRLVRARLSTFTDRRALINSLGHDGLSHSLRSELHVQVDTDAMSVTSTWVDLGSIELPSVGPTTIVPYFQHRADSPAQTATDIPNRAALLLPPGWGGVWMHEAVGHLLEADTVLSGASPMDQLLGKSVSIGEVDIVDDGTFEPARVVGGFDDEGVETMTTPLIEHGVVIGLLTDRESARSHGLPMTGNGRRPHFGLPPRPRMTNLLMRSGPLTREKLHEMADPLIVVDTLRHAWFDVEDRRMHLAIDEATLLLGGKPEGRIGPFIASAEPLQLLRNVAGVGNDFSVDLHRGYCLKDGAAVPVTIGQPSVLITDLAIGSAST